MHQGAPDEQEAPAGDGNGNGTLDSGGADGGASDCVDRLLEIGGKHRVVEISYGGTCTGGTTRSKRGLESGPQVAPSLGNG